jgi:ATP-dependent Clp protease ATP-binding subunit ClpC
MGSSVGGEMRGVFEQAREVARGRKQPLSTGHLLLVLLRTQSEAAEVLAQQGVQEGALLSALKVVGEEPGTAVNIAYERATKLATTLGEGTPGVLHLLLTLACEPRSAAHRCLEQCGVGAARVHAEVCARLGVVPGRDDASANGERPPARPTTLRPPLPPTPIPSMPIPTASSAPPTAHPDPHATRRLTRPGPPITPTRTTTRVGTTGRAPSARPPAPSSMMVSASGPAQAQAPQTANASSRFALDERTFPTLVALSRNLTQLAESGAIDPVIGRDAEIEKLLDILARRRSNNPLLVGPPGVGKTAVVEGLALRLARGESGLPNEPVLLEISAGALVSGTGVRGALAERLARLRAEVARAEGRVLLFLDEIHAIVGGDASGPDDLASELKAALARGELPCIGATTDAEYRKHIERDPALARRFSRLEVGEPSPEDCVRILEGLAPRYEQHHGVTFAPDAIAQAVALSVRFLPERQLPDKALGLLDLAAARARRRGVRVVDLEAVARVISEQARVPLERLMLRDRERMLGLESLVAERVVGQRAAIARIADALRKGAAGFRGRRPLGTFLLLGPTGVGKTETARAISEVLFAASDFTRLDMSEYAEPHAIARLLGAPPGYLGHDEGGQLTEAVRRRPYQLVLLDEIEKAHPEVLLALLPLLDEGRMTDGRGRTVDFTNTVIVMTSNLGVGASRERPSRSIGFGDRDARAQSAPDQGELALAAARRALPPELWNRIDEPLWFAPLGLAEVESIAARMIAQVAAVLAKEHHVTLVVEPSALSALAAAGGFDPELGARPMRRTVGRLVESPLAERVLSGSAQAGDVLVLSGEGAAVRITRRGEARADAAE